jgi:hypothetical protein
MPFWCGQGQLYLRKGALWYHNFPNTDKTDYPLPQIILQVTVTDISDFLVKILSSLATPPAHIKHLHHKHLSCSSSAVIYSPLHSHFELQHANPLTISRLLLPQKPINDAILIYHKYLELPIQKNTAAYCSNQHCRYFRRVNKWRSWVYLTIMDQTQGYVAMNELKRWLCILKCRGRWGDNGRGVLQPQKRA